MKLAYRNEAPPEQKLQGIVQADAELVGNENVFSALARGIRCILFYDTKTRTNAMNDYGFPKTYLIKGEPGCGKTTAIKCAVRYGRELSAKTGRVLFVTNIGNKFKSEYYSRSAQELRKLFSVFYSGSSINIGIIEDIDTVFSGRNPLINAEDSANLGEMLNLLEGVESVNLGNYIIISTTNNSLEPALEQRLSECVLEAKGPETAGHYERLLRINLKGLEKFIECDFFNTAGILKEKKFSGRDVKNICRAISAEMISFEPNPEIYLLELAKQKEFLDGSFRGISVNDIGRIITSYENMQKAMQNKKVYK